ncbi:hypothetical protein ACJX0J_032847, partial [Zea mays]
MVYIVLTFQDRVQYEVTFGENMFIYSEKRLSVRNQLIFATWVLLMFTNGLDKKRASWFFFFLCFIAMDINYLLVPYNYDTDTFFKVDNLAIVHRTWPFGIHAIFI